MEDLSVYQGNGRFVTEPEAFEVMVGGLKSSFEVTRKKKRKGSRNLSFLIKLFNFVLERSWSSSCYYYACYTYYQN